MNPKSAIGRRILLFLYEVVLPTVGLLVLATVTYLVTGLAMRTDTPIRVVQIDMSPPWVTSMYPTLMAGDIILVEGVRPEEVKVGDVIVFPRSYSTTPIIHRVIEIIHLASGNRLFRTKGDYNAIPDSTPVSGEDLLGRWTGLKVQLLGFPIIFAMDPAGRAVVIALIVALSVHSILTSDVETSEPLGSAESARVS